MSNRRGHDTKVSAKWQIDRHLAALADGPRRAYPGLLVDALEYMVGKGLVAADRLPKYETSPATLIMWQLTDEGHRVLGQEVK